MDLCWGDIDLAVKQFKESQNYEFLNDIFAYSSFEELRFILEKYDILNDEVIQEIIGFQYFNSYTNNMRMFAKYFKDIIMQFINDKLLLAIVADDTGMFTKRSEDYLKKHFNGYIDDFTTGVFIDHIREVILSDINDETRVTDDMLEIFTYTVDLILRIEKDLKLDKQSSTLHDIVTEIIILNTYYIFYDDIKNYDRIFPHPLDICLKHMTLSDVFWILDKPDIYSPFENGFEYLSSKYSINAILHYSYCRVHGLDVLDFKTLLVNKEANDGMINIIIPGRMLGFDIGITIQEDIEVNNDRRFNKNDLMKFLMEFLNEIYPYQVMILLGFLEGIYSGEFIFGLSQANSHINFYMSNQENAKETARTLYELLLNDPTNNVLINNASHFIFEAISNIVTDEYEEHFKRPEYYLDYHETFRDYQENPQMYIEKGVM